MDFNEYQMRAMALAQYPQLGANILYPAMGLAGEAGEAIDKVKKIWRNQGLTSASGYSKEQRVELAKEIGDVLWYISAMAFEMGNSLDDIAQMNLAKLEDRTARGVVKGEGDNR